MTFFIILQTILLLFMLFHDWISIPPLNDLAAIKAQDSTISRVLGTIFNSLTVFIPLLITFVSYDGNPVSFALMAIIATFYFCLTLGTILSWWIPYFSGSSAKHKQQFARFKNTHCFLSSRGDNVVPNTLHVIIHLQVWLCLLWALYFLLFH